MNWKLGEPPDEELIKAFSLAFSTTFLKKDENNPNKKKDKKHKSFIEQNKKEIEETFNKIKMDNTGDKKTDMNIELESESEEENTPVLQSKKKS
jgi:hypothetical protein